MRAAYFKEHGGAEKIIYGDYPDPVPVAGEALVRLVACGVCHTDLYTASRADPSGYAPTVLGHELAMPLIVAPVAFQRVAHPDGEVGMARAAAAAGTVMCLSTMSTSTPAEVAAAAGISHPRRASFGCRFRTALSAGPARTPHRPAAADSPRRAHA